MLSIHLNIYFVFVDVMRYSLIKHVDGTGVASMFRVTPSRVRGTQRDHDEEHLKMTQMHQCSRM